MANNGVYKVQISETLRLCVVAVRWLRSLSLAEGEF